ncbi:MAG TPA: M20/M25/M40 family metallo-hydrolase [Polyangiaceae bacterium]
MRRLALLLAAVLVSTADAADLPARADSRATPDAALTLQREELTRSNATAFVRSLCDEVGPRLAGSPGDRAAVAWALRTMQGMGLANVHAEKVKVTRWERGEGRAEIVAPFPQPLLVAALGGSVGTPPGGLTGDVVEATSIAELEKLDPLSVRGKLVFLNPPMRRARDGAGYGEAVGNRARGARAAAKLGATGLLLRSIGTDHDRVAHTGAKAKDEHEIPAAALSVPDAELLHRVLAQSKTVRVHLVLGARTLPDAESANVMGEVTGRERPGEIVLVGAHLDSWDLGTGAVDDGAGVGIALETARLFAALPGKPRRTLRVVLFANEEHGLQGAKEYARVHAAEAAAHVAATEADFGGDAVYAVRWLGDPSSRERFVALARSLAPLGVERQDEAGHGGADITPLQELGVPLLDLRQDGTRYFDYHHTANDTVDKIDPPTLAQAAAAFATAAWAVADMEGDLGRVPEGQRKEHW